jgi:hypothetical protein
MFLTHDNLRIEVKQNDQFNINFKSNVGIGFCLPCLRMHDAKAHLNKLKEIQVTKEIINPDGIVIFFKDYEGIEWHIKNYDILDEYVNV